MRLGQTPLSANGHAALGEADLLAALSEHIHDGPPPMYPAPVPHDAQMAVLTLAIHDLTDAVLDLTAALNRPPWYVRLVRWLRSAGA